MIVMVVNGMGEQSLWSGPALLHAECPPTLGDLAAGPRSFWETAPHSPHDSQGHESEGLLADS